MPAPQIRVGREERHEGALRSRAPKRAPGPLLRSPSGGAGRLGGEARVWVCLRGRRVRACSAAQVGGGWRFSQAPEPRPHTPLGSGRREAPSRDARSPGLARRVPAAGRVHAAPRVRPSSGRTGQPEGTRPGWVLERLERAEKGGSQGGATRPGDASRCPGKGGRSGRTRRLAVTARAPRRPERSPVPGQGRAGGTPQGPVRGQRAAQRGARGSRDQRPGRPGVLHEAGR